MRRFLFLLGLFVTSCLLLAGIGAQAEEAVTTLNFAVTRNGEQIGSTSVKLRQRGDQTTAETATNVQVKIAFITVYRYEQHLAERWIGAKLTALSAVTDDNGSIIHRVSATRSGDILSVDADGKISQVDPATVP